VAKRQPKGTPRAKAANYKVEIDFPANGKMGCATVTALDRQGNVLGFDKGDLRGEPERRKLAGRLAQKLGRDPDDLQKKLEAALNARVTQHRQEQAGGRPSPPYSPCSPCSRYGVSSGRLCQIRYHKDGTPYPDPLCNFVARVVSEEILDDGSGEDRHTFAVEGQLCDGTALPHISVQAADFGGMHWPIKGWGLRAVVEVGCADHLRVAIQFLSASAPRHRIFKHTGWRELEGGWAYLHAGGAIGPGGSIPPLRVELEGALADYLLPEPPAGDALRAAVRADLRLLGFAQPRLMYPLLGAVYRAVLGGVDCSVGLVGRTGLGKSELLALAQQHYGAGMDRLHLPASWTSTANALEGLAFLAKDALLGVDDFKPRGNKSEIDGMHAKADRLLQAQGNRSARQRCWSDGTVRVARPPRGLIVTTGEDQVRGESLRARQLTLLVKKGDFDIRDLTPHQRDAAGGLYAQALVGFLRWLAPHYAEIRSRLPREQADWRNSALAEGSHPRTPGIVADLALGLHYFLDFAVACGALTPAERAAHARSGWQALLTAAAEQTQEILAQDPARRFLQLIDAVLTSERGHLADRDGRSPLTPSTKRFAEHFSSSSPRGALY
jgi:hypothetical protein